VRLGWYTTVIRTADGRTYDLGAGQRRPFHDHNGGWCRACLVVSAGTVHVDDLPHPTPCTPVQSGGGGGEG
jgi:hypothetical protein